MEIILEKVVAEATNSDGGGDSKVVAFRACRGLPDGEDFRQNVMEFCRSVIRSAEVKQEIEPLVQLLITYATQNFENHEQQRPPIRDDVPEHQQYVHVSRSGSIDVSIG